MYKAMKQLLPKLLDIAANKESLSEWVAVVGRSPLVTPAIIPKCFCGNSSNAVYISKASGNVIAACNRCARKCVLGGAVLIAADLIDSAAVQDFVESGRLANVRGDDAVTRIAGATFVSAAAALRTRNNMVEALDEAENVLQLYSGDERQVIVKLRDAAQRLRDCIAKNIAPLEFKRAVFRVTNRLLVARDEADDYEKELKITNTVEQSIAESIACLAKYTLIYCGANDIHADNDFDIETRIMLEYCCTYIAHCIRAAAHTYAFNRKSEYYRGVFAVEYDEADVVWKSNNVHLYRDNLHVMIEWMSYVLAARYRSPMHCANSKRFGQLENDVKFTIKYHESQRARCMFVKKCERIGANTPLRKLISLRGKLAAFFRGTSGCDQTRMMCVRLLDELDTAIRDAAPAPNKKI
jgi:hypothetical protein